jgi:hypothetical protein
MEDLVPKYGHEKAALIKAAWAELDAYIRLCQPPDMR